MLRRITFLIFVCLGNDDKSCYNAHVLIQEHDAILVLVFLVFTLESSCSSTLLLFLCSLWTVLVLAHFLYFFLHFGQFFVWHFLCFSIHFGQLLLWWFFLVLVFVSSQCLILLSSVLTTYKYCCSCNCLYM